MFKGCDKALACILCSLHTLKSLCPCECRYGGISKAARSPVTRFPSSLAPRPHENHCKTPDSPHHPLAEAGPMQTPLTALG